MVSWEARGGQVGEQHCSLIVIRATHRPCPQVTVPTSFIVLKIPLPVKSVSIATQTEGYPDSLEPRDTTKSGAIAIPHKRRCLQPCPRERFP